MMKSISLKAIAFLATVGALFAARADYTVTTSATVADLGGATGGDEIRMITAGSKVDIIHIFTSTSAVGKLVMPSDTSKFVSGSGRLLVVGGGGAGGNHDGSSRSGGGGGGAGGLVYRKGLDFTAGATYTATVGAGGATGGNNGASGSKTTFVLPSETITADGGGGGGRRGYVGSSGGSAGGSGSGSYTQTATQPTSTSGGYGNVGGHAGSTDSTYYGGGGGGGAGGAGTSGEDGSRPGNGGDGLAYDISGETAYYAGGGGGGAQSEMTEEKLAAYGLGGSGVGGRGGHKGLLAAGAGKDGTGSGGGGAGGTNTSSSNGAGGSGIVIVRYTLVTQVDTIDSDQALELGGASGGDEVRMIDNGDHTYELIHIFTNTADAATLEIPEDNKIVAGSYRVLAVGGGGSGSGNCGGGGGAGGLVYQENLSFAAGATIDITVGAGGAKSAGNSTGNAGGASLLSIGGTALYTANGGGYAGRWGATAGGAGGSGGGGGAGGAGGASNQVAPGIGNAGGTSSGSVGAGGGGAGGRGSNSSGNVGGAGGVGLAYDIAGFSSWYAGGGGGAGFSSAGNAGGAGGSGVGGAGTTGATDQTGGSGQDGTGSGGGGAAGGGGTSYGGAGGSGIVIIRYTVDPWLRVQTDAGEIATYGATTNWVVDADTGASELVIKYTDTEKIGGLILPSYVTASYLAVGGGGAGGSGYGGLTAGAPAGGGAGGFVELGMTTPISFARGEYEIHVGAGGVPGSTGSTNVAGGDGSNSWINVSGSAALAGFVAYGGGGGGSRSAGRAGGCGGGGSKAAGGAARDATQGYAGGSGASHNRVGAGGGGAGGKGGDTGGTTSPGSGGAGKSSEITGSTVWYAAGGGGGTYNGAGGAAGACGDQASVGGAGGHRTSSTDVTSGEDGKNGFGGGGGGGAGQTSSTGHSGGHGGSGVVIIRIRKVMPAKPTVTATEVGWSGSEVSLYTGSEKVVITYVSKNGTTIGTIADNAAATDVGTHVFTVKPATGYTWSDGTDDTVTLTITINKAKLKVNSFKLEGWQAGEANNEPVLEVVDANGQTVTVTPTYTWRVAGAASWKAWATTKPSTAGDYEIKATFTGTADFDPPSEMQIATFSLWAAREAPVAGLGYSYDFTLGGGEGNVVIVEVSEALVKGFGYSEAEALGADVRFTDKDGNLLPMKLGGWNVDGCSWFYVKVPSNTAGETLTMSWGRVTGAELADAPALDDDELVYHFAFDGTVTYTGSGAKVTFANDGTTPEYTTVGFAEGDQAMSVWTGYTGGSMAFPTAYSVACVAKVSPTSRSGEYNMVWSFGTPSAGGIGLASDVAGKVRFIEWTSASAVVVIAEGTVESPAESYHRYRVDINDTAATLFVDGVSVGSGTLTKAWTSVPMQFGATYTAMPAGYWKAGDYSLDDWAVSPLSNATPTGGNVIVTPNATFENRWLVEPTLPATEWGTGEEPAITPGTPLYGGPAYFVISTLAGEEFTKNTFPTAPGRYTIVFKSDAGRTSGTISWTGLATTPVTIQVTAHSPQTDLSGTAGNESLSGRVLLCNNYTEDGQSVVGQNYDNTALGSVYWEHDDTAAQFYKHLRIGSNHVLASTNEIAELCGASTIWTIKNSYLGNTHDSEVISAQAQVFLPPERGETEGSASTHIVMRNETSAAVISPCYTNGIGTIYFDAVNGWVPAQAGDYSLVVQVVYGVTDTADEITEEQWAAGTRAINAIKVTGNSGEKLSPTNELELAVTTANSESEFYRCYVDLEDYHGPVRFRIKRVGLSSAHTTGTAGYILLDNIIVSYPAMRADLLPCGRYDATRTGKQVLGFENAWSVPFPGLRDTVTPRARATYYTNPGNTNAQTSVFITGANIHYRWRYLNQQTNEWASVKLDNATLDAPLEALNLKNARGEVLPGDVEFWYDLTLNAPYYKYVDYAAVSGFKMSEYYSEEITAVTNHSTGVTYDSLGTDWFVRLREGKSDYEGLEIRYRYADDENVVTNTVAMELIADNTWRGYVQTLEELPEGFAYQIVFKNLQTAGSANFAWSTNYYAAGEAHKGTPVNEGLTAGTAESWTTMPCDAKTGYLLFQVDDSTKAVSIVHADYQNFNAWTDANKEGKFLGSSIKDSGKTGVSAKAVSHQEPFAGWQDMPATNVYWNESFTTASSLAYGDYVSFNESTSPNGWTAGPGMWVYGLYSDDSTSGTPAAKNRAFQMKGQGNGYFQFANAAEAPRGLESITFGARIGQAIQSTDFSYYMNGGESSNYTFIVRAAFDENGNTKFRGNASLSLIANYRPGIGCYEFRFEQYKGSATTGITKNSQKMSLYRWRGDTSTKLGEYINGGDNNNFNIPDPGAGTGLMPMFLSVSNGVDAVYIVAGVYRDGGVNATTDIRTYCPESNSKYQYDGFCYKDIADSRLKRGTYGLLAANCPGVFFRPCKNTKPVSGVTPKQTYVDQFRKAKVSFPGTMEEDVGQYCHKDASGNYVADRDAEEMDWYTREGRMVPFASNATYNGFRAQIPTNTVTIYTAPYGKDVWTPLKVVTVDGFGEAGASGQKQYDYNFYTTTDSRVRLTAGGDPNGVRDDIVIDDVVVRQWRGDNYVNEESLIPNWTSEDNYLAHTNFTFTSCWIKDEGLLMSAKRTASGTPCAIRSPLFDDNYDRGIGLGMISYTFDHAQANTRVLVQVAKDVTYERVTQIDNLDDKIWTTVATNTFTAGESGTRQCYIGLHGVRGVMRLLIDPELVNAVSNETDTAKFGEIHISEVFCRNEPNLDSTCWWGWNLRTLGNGEDTERRMYLDDVSTTSGALGQSLALNNSISNDVFEIDGVTYEQHLPFVQSPTFGTNLIGEVTFRARKYEGDAAAAPAKVVIYGSRTGEENDRWVSLAKEGGAFMVSNTTYTTYSFKTPQNDNYRAFRLVVNDVQGVTGTDMDTPAAGATPVRVLLDEILISEAVRARVGFRNVGAFRGYWKNGNASLEDLNTVPNVPSTLEQPLCSESWGVQCEIYKAQLTNEIDFTRAPRVLFHWYVGSAPWGYENWSDKASGTAWLIRARDTDDDTYIFRSSYQGGSDNVVSPVTKPGTVVQYMLEVIYYQVGSTSPVTNQLTAADWEIPAWYSPLDLNATRGGGYDFAAYNILDTVAPGWAWINEANIFGGEEDSLMNKEKDFQYIEVAAPREADLTGWKINVLAPHQATGLVITNTLLTFGRNGIGATKANGTGAVSNMVFRVFANEATRDAGNIEACGGTLDGVWSVQEPVTEISEAGTLNGLYPFGVQLVRASGIVEHEVLLVGTDAWSDSSEQLQQQHSPANNVAFLQSNGARSIFFPGFDNATRASSIGVIKGSGTANDWINLMTKTPGLVNVALDGTLQALDPDVPTPNGSSIRIYCNLDASGHLRQNAAGVITNGYQSIFVKKGGDGTNITYYLDQWWELASVVTNGAAVTLPAKGADNTYRVLVGKGASNDVTVTASAQVDSKLRNEYGLTEDNRYTPAVVDWLAKGVTARGAFHDTNGDGIYRAEYLNMAGRIAGRLTLTEMYWLDIDPTYPLTDAADETNSVFALMGGMAKAPGTSVVEGYAGTTSVTNVQMGIFMMITNRTADATSDDYGAAWTPYMLRGVEPGMTSTNYDESGSAGWTGVTFKVTALVANGRTSESTASDWVPVRWFVFGEDSFLPLDAATDAGRSYIEVRDPHSISSPAYWAGAKDWPDSPIFYRWAIDDRLQPVNVEMLAPTNFYGKATN